jgi:hypothetical protein
MMSSCKLTRVWPALRTITIRRWQLPDMLATATFLYAERDLAVLERRG